MNMIRHREFPLTAQAGRVALLLGVMDGTVTQAEVQAAVTQDVQPRPRVKPVMAMGTRYASVKQAAMALAGSRDYDAVTSMRRRIARECNNDYRGRAHPDFYWCE